jgi:hypothetical protein
MNLRPEFQTPPLDETLVARLADLAATIDGARPGEADDELAEFNALAGTTFEADDFQGIYGGEEHVQWVRRLLLTRLAPVVSDLTRDDLIAAFARILARDDRSEEDRDYLCATLHRSLDDPRIEELIDWPGEYFGDGDNSRSLTPEEMADAALAKRRERLKNE